MPAQQQTHHEQSTVTTPQTPPETDSVQTYPSLLTPEPEQTVALSISLADESTWGSRQQSEEIKRFSTTLTYLNETYELAKRHALSLTTAFRSPFVMALCTRDELLNCDGVGPAVYEMVTEDTPAGVPSLTEHPLPPVFEPSGWAASVHSRRTQPPGESSPQYWDQLQFYHHTSATIISISKIEPNRFVPALSPANADPQTGVVFNEATGMTPSTIFKFLDILFGHVPPSGYHFNRTYAEVESSLNTELNLVPPRSHAASTSKGPNTLIHADAL